MPLYTRQHLIDLSNQQQSKVADWMHDESRKKIIAIDFDGTIVEPGAGPNKEKLKFLPNAQQTIKYLYQNFYIILWTCRQGQMLEDAAEFLVQNDVRFHQVNANNPELPFKTSDKIFADFYIDDLAQMAPIDWPNIQRFLTQKFLQPHADPSQIIDIVVEGVHI